MMYDLRSTIYEVRFTICTGHLSQNRKSKIVHRKCYCHFLNATWYYYLPQGVVFIEAVTNRGN